MSLCIAKCRWVTAGLIYLSAVFSNLAQNQAVYTDSLQNNWENYGWTQINYNNTSPVHSGSMSISVTVTQAWQAIYIAHAAFNSGAYSNLVFWLNGGASGGQQLQIQGHAGGSPQTAVSLTPPAANTWSQYTVSLASMGVANRTDMDGFWIQGANNAQPTFYLDDIVLTTNSTPPPTVTLTAPADGSTYTLPASIALAANVVSNGQTITKVQFYSNSTNLLNEDTTPPYSFNWNNASLGYYSLIARVIYGSGASVDSAAVNVTVIGNTAVTIAVDAQQNRRPISPLIYGVAFASSNQLSDGNFTLNRSGGNSETRYNWQLNAHNHAADWYFESIDDGSSTPAATADDFVANSKNGGAQPLLTIPMIGWPPILGSGRSKLASYSTNKYGPQTGTDWQWMPNAGNGVSSTNGDKAITWNNPNDASFPTNSAFQGAFIQHLTNRWHWSTNGGVPYYLLDNEHSIWFATHQDVHPVGPTMQEIWGKMLDYASVVKSNDPNALVLGPEEWGWNGYLYSGYDQQNPGYHDRATNGGWDYMPWLLNQFHQHDTSTGQRLLDYFTLHCYPQEGNVSGNAVDTTTVLLRNQSTRVFWDTNYVDPSWINSIIMLIPRMKNWVTAYYPGTKIGVTEYNWGGEGNISGATAEADILGIFGREGLDLATRWTAVATTDPVHMAMKMYRNYDGNKSTFGDTSISASGPNPDNVSTFGAIRASDGALTLMVINKQLTSSASATVSLANFLPAGTGQVWQLTSANTITRLSDISISGATFTSTVPVQSITLFVLPAAVLAGPASNPSPANGATSVPTNTSLTWTAGTNATAHRLFFGVSSNAVANATTNSPEFKGNPATTNYNPGPLSFGTTYYWRVDEMAGVASNPTPANGATGVATNTALSWTAGANASAHQLYFGANSSAVASATTNSPEFQGTLLTTTSTPGPLASSGRFYWRVDELAGVNATAGPVWTFATAVNPNDGFPLIGGFPTSNSFLITFPSQIGQTYRVEWTVRLSPTSWQTVTDNVPGTGYSISIQDTNASLQTQRFYRALILPP